MFPVPWSPNQKNPIFKGSVPCLFSMLPSYISHSSTLTYNTCHLSNLFLLSLPHTFLLQHFHWSNYLTWCEWYGDAAVPRLFALCCLKSGSCENYHVVNGRSLALGEQCTAQVDLFLKPLSVLMLKGHAQMLGTWGTERWSALHHKNDPKQQEDNAICMIKQ